MRLRQKRFLQFNETGAGLTCPFAYVRQEEIPDEFREYGDT